jgi:opacity protein-like surface antigen
MDLSKKGLVALSVFGFLFAAASFAAPAQSSGCAHTNDRYYVGGQVALGGNTMVHTENVAVEDLKDQVYKSRGGATVFPDFGINGGMIYHMNSRWSLDYGLGFYANTKQDVKGDYYTKEDATDPALTYKYTIAAQRLYAEARAVYHFDSVWSSFIGAGMGVGFIHSSKVNYAKAPGSSASPFPSKANTDTNVIYALNAGIDYKVSGHWHVNTGFSQEFWGKHHVKVDEGYGYKKTDLGKLTPWKIWLGVGYRF